MTHDRTDRIDELANGNVRLSVKIKRGENPRNEEEIKGELIAEDLDELKDELREFNQLLEAQGRKFRNFQPERLDSEVSAD